MIAFTKMQAVGNDFIVVRDAEAPSATWSAFAQSACERCRGIGADGLLVVGDGEHADAKVRMFNPDGTEDHCGNGMRCVVRFELDAGRAEIGRELRLETLAGIRTATIAGTHDDPRITIDMGEPRFSPAEIPMSVVVDPVVDYALDVEGESVRVTALSTGTTHTVIFSDPAGIAERFDRLSPAISVHPVFPERTSVLWVTVESPERLSLRIWERGAGETLGCGTGACAAMVAARLHGYVGDRCVAASRGGELTAEWTRSGPIWLTGTARTLFRGTYASTR